jgi:pyroglutamyl-peptidase
MRIAFTGFGPFPGVLQNPTASLIEALRRSNDLAFADCSFDVLDVAYSAVGPALDRVLAQSPRALVMTGFSRHAAALQLESIATNVCAAQPDSAGYVPEGNATITWLACPHIAFAALAGLLTEAGIPAEVSEDAGQYVCNHTLYTAQTRLAGSKTPALFVHIPAIEGTDLALTSAGALPLADLVRAMALIARQLAP